MARLPTPYQDAGVWGQILNDFLSQSLASDGALKPGVVGAQQITDGSLPQTKVQNLQTDLAAKLNTAAKGAPNGVAELDGGTKVPIAQLPAGATASTVALGNHTHPANGDSRTTYPLLAIGAFTASFEPDMINTGSGISADFFARVFVPANHAITSVGLYATSAGVLGAGGENGFAVYDDSGTFVASTPSDNNLWTSAGWRSKSFTTPIPAQSSDRFVYVSPLISGYATGMNIIYYGGRQEMTDGVIGFTNKRRAFFHGSLTSWPSSFNPATFGNSAGGFIPFLALA